MKRTRLGIVEEKKRKGGEEGEREKKKNDFLKAEAKGWITKNLGWLRHPIASCRVSNAL